MKSMVAGGGGKEIYRQCAAGIHTDKKSLASGQKRTFKICPICAEEYNKKRKKSKNM